LIAAVLAITLTLAAVFNSVGAIIRQWSVRRARAFSNAGSIGNTRSISDSRSIASSWAFDAAGSIGNSRALAAAGPFNPTRARARGRQGARSIL
jgi:hypothetical protein